LLDFTCIFGKDKKKRKPVNLTGFLCYVDYYDKISNLLEDLREVERFAQYIEDQSVE
jgi:hypothetical protein